MSVAAKRRFVGEYTLNYSVGLIVSLDGERLNFRIPGGPPVPLFPQSSTSFYMSVHDNLRVDFVVDASNLCLN